MIKLMTTTGAEVSAHEYKLEPKSKFTAGTMKLDGAELPIKVTGVGHKKFPAYTYATIDGQLYYAKGDYRNQELKKAAAPTEAPKAEEKQPEPPKPDAKPLTQPQGKHGRK